MEKVDYRKKDKSLYSLSAEPTIIEIPKMNFVAVKGRGDPNEVDGEYADALNLLYGISYTIKMSKKSDETPAGYHDFVVPPLEGLWDVGLDQLTYAGVIDKSQFEWVSLIRLPEFVMPEIFDWASEKLKQKKPDLDISKVFHLSFAEGLCAQILHVGSYDAEKATIDRLGDFVAGAGYVEDFDMEKYRYHHEIYLNDPRKTVPEKLKTIIRHPVLRV